MSELLLLQLVFPRLVCALISELYGKGLECSFGEAWRAPEQAAIDAAQGRGILHSEHCNRLAIDLNVFRDGVYQRDTADYAELGAFWVLQHPNARWGGNFSRRDGNHFSLEYGGSA